MPKDNAADKLFFSAKVAPGGSTLEVRLVRSFSSQIEIGRVGSHDSTGGSDGEAEDNGNGPTPIRIRVGGGKIRRLGRNRLGPRAKSIPARKLTREEIRAGQVLRTDPKWEFLAQVQRPKTRRDCWTAEQALEQMGVDDGKGDGCNSKRPCPFVLCKWHPYTDVNPETGTIKLNFPHLEVWQLRVSCALDVAEAGGDTLEGVGNDMNLTRERVRQVQVRGLINLHATGVDTDMLGAALKLADKIREGEEP